MVVGPSCSDVNDDVVVVAVVVVVVVVEVAFQVAVDTFVAGVEDFGLKGGY